MCKTALFHPARISLMREEVKDPGEEGDMVTEYRMRKIWLTLLYEQSSTISCILQGPSPASAGVGMKNVGSKNAD